VEIGKPQAELDFGWVEVIQPEKLDIFRKASSVVAAIEIRPFNRDTIRSDSGDGSSRARLGGGLEDTGCFELRVASEMTLAVESLGNREVDFIVGDQHASSLAAIASVEQERRVEGRARAGEKVDD